MKILWLFGVAVFILSACNQKEKPCPQMMPPIPTSPYFTLTDKITGVSIVDSLDIMKDSVSASQPCHTHTAPVSYEKADGQLLFVFENIQFDGNNGCKTMYINLHNSDTDTITIEGYRRTYNENDPCGPYSEFIVDKVFYNGAEASKYQVTKYGRAIEYYALKK